MLLPNTMLSEVIPVSTRVSCFGLLLPWNNVGQAECECGLLLQAAQHEEELAPRADEASNAETFSVDVIMPTGSQRAINTPFTGIWGPVKNGRPTLFSS